MNATALALHAVWYDGSLCLWAEDPGIAPGPIEPGSPDPAMERAHPYGATEARLRGAVGAIDRDAVGSSILVRLPARDGVPALSPGAGDVPGRATPAAPPSLCVFRVPCLAVAPDRSAAVLERLTEQGADTAAGDGDDTEQGGVRAFTLAPSVEFFAAAARFVRHMVAQERYVPALVQVSGGSVQARWQPWMSDEATARRLAGLVRAMPPVARAVVDHFQHDPAAILEDFLTSLLDAACRGAFKAEDLASAVSERDPDTDAHVAWLGGLLGDATDVRGTIAARQDIVRRVRQWIGGLEERGASAAWRLCLKLVEPDAALLSANDPAGLSADAPAWKLSFHLQAVDRGALLLDASDIWLLPGHSVTIGGRRVENPQEILLGELGRASKIYARLEHALSDARPVALELTTRLAYEFLREFRPLLQEQGFGVEAPEWWDSPSARLGVKLRLDSPDALPEAGAGSASRSAVGSQFGLGTLVKYRWDIAVGDLSLTLKEFEDLAARRTPLVRINGRWVEVRPEDVQAAVKFLRENPGGQVKVADAMRMAYGADLKQTGLPVVGLEASGWLAGLLGGESAAAHLEILPAPATFLGTLRPYQLRGVSWLEFLERLGLGSCLADDMGLGKTIQLLALLAHEREAAAAQPEPPHIGPTLLIVPMSVVGNWIHETKRFTPHLKMLVQHGPERLMGETLLERAAASDLVLTTYALAHRDIETLSKVAWRRLVLDEAQYIKNPVAKQSQAVRSIPAEHRVALTGTPVENRLSELWSIMDFLNPGYLGGPAQFRTRFAVPVERYRDKARAEQLRSLIRPFVLRRLKTDPTVVADLPEKIEGREFCHLTSEQASLYESCVRRMLGEVDQADGIHRRGLVLSALIRLKQVCNHPAQMLREHAEGGGDIAHAVDPRRSGKCVRLLEMLEEVLAEGDQALVFTQFRQMGHLLQHMIRKRFERDVLFLHGGTNQQQRQGIVDAFQRADGTHPVLILSLRAGGVGLNLTAGTHVFHFDRWWNPAVENQATDRAYRIGQTRTVQVHKFVVRGTLEERIDEMIEQKTELATNIIGSGERWLTELTTTQLRDILALRADAVGDEA